jgi:hypothetical protein
MYYDYDGRSCDRNRLFNHAYLALMLITTTLSFLYILVLCLLLSLAIMQPWLRLQSYVPSSIPNY